MRFVQPIPSLSGLLSRSHAGEDQSTAGLDAPHPGKHPLSLPESLECRRSRKCLSGLYAEGGVKTWNFSGCFCTYSPQAFQPHEVEAHGVRRKPPTSSPGRLCLRKVRNPCSVSIQTIPSLCLREEVLPVWKPTWPAQAGVSSWIVAILWQDWVATLGDWLGLACWQLSWIPKVPFLLSPDQLGMEIFKSCSLGIGVELRGICPLLG